MGKGDAFQHGGGGDCAGGRAGAADADFASTDDVCAERDVARDAQAAAAAERGGPAREAGLELVDRLVERVVEVDGEVPGAPRRGHRR